MVEPPFTCPGIFGGDRLGKAAPTSDMALVPGHPTTFMACPCEHMRETAPE
jgi:hypothetical protein